MLDMSIKVEKIIDDLYCGNVGQVSDMEIMGFRAKERDKNRADR